MQYLPRLSAGDSHNFSRIPEAKVPRSVFNLSHSYKTAFDSGYLIPIMCEEALPGDTWSVNLKAVARLATPIVPFMDSLYLDFHFFSVPNRILWTNWVKFMGEQDNPGDSISYTVPIITAHSPATGSLGDYMGLPVGAGNVTANALHHRAYNMIWNQWYRDENLQNSVNVPNGDGPDNPSNYTLLKRGKRHDYFTSCLPWPIKGTESTLDLGTSANVLADYTLGSQPVVRKYSDNTLAGAGDIQVGATGGQFVYGGTPDGGMYDPNGTLYADLSTAVGPTVNSFRETIYLQHMLERDARGGTRYCEIIRSHFNVTDPMSAILQRPLYLGGGTTTVQITPIPQTSESNTTKQGTLAAVGFAQEHGVGFHQSFTEHCVIIGLVSCRASMTYQRGLRKMWTRQTRADYYFPSLAHLGEQAVLNKEIYHQGTAADTNVFGYQERWGELRYGVSQVTGILRSDAASNIDEWHLAQDFGSLPTLDSTFIQETPPVSRVVATPTEPELIFDGYFNVKCARPMPVYSVPGMGSKL